MIKKIFISIVVAFLLIMMLLVHSIFVATKGLITKEYTIVNQDLPESYDGFKIVHFSDILYSSITNKKDIDKIVEEIDLIKPDIIIFSGDLVRANYKLKALDKHYLIEKLASMNSRYGKYAIIGDNDYEDLTTIKDIYLNSNFIVLDNSYDVIYNDKHDAIFIGGLANFSNNLANIDEVMNNENSNIEYKIIVMHEPDYVSNISSQYNINLILAGHSLNGQVNIPIIKNILLQKGATKYYKNYYKINNTDMYISSGIGVFKSNFRLFNKPSINFYRLKNE